MRSSLLLLAACGRVGFDEVSEPPTTRLCERHPTARYCNDFDDRDLSAAYTDDGMLLDGGGFRGSVGYRFDAAPGEMPRIGVDLGSPITSGSVYLGARFFLAGGSPPVEYVVMAQFLADNFTDKQSFDLVFEDRAQLVNDASGGLVGISDPAAVPRDTWTCFVLAVVADPAGGSGSVTLSFDGVRVIGGEPVEPTVGPLGFARAELGAFSAPANTAAVSIVYDDWVVDTAPLGCP